MGSVGIYLGMSIAFCFINELLHKHHIHTHTHRLPFDFITHYWSFSCMQEVESAKTTDSLRHIEIESIYRLFNKIVFHRRVALMKL